MHDLRTALTLIALVVAMVLAGAIGLRQRTGIVVLALLSFSWLTLDRQFEGGVLITVTKDNGLTVADLVGIAGFIACAVLWLRLHRRR